MSRELRSRLGSNVIHIQSRNEKETIDIMMAMQRTKAMIIALHFGYLSQRPRGWSCKEKVGHRRVWLQARSYDR